MNIIPIKDWYVREAVKKDLDYIYIFTDNIGRTSGHIPIFEDSIYMRKFPHAKRGDSTQAIIRGLHNAFPISTVIDDKRRQWDDKYFSTFKSIIDTEIRDILDSLKMFKGIKYNNEMQFGNANISKLRFTAPKCWEYLNKKLLEIGIDNVTGYE